HSSRARASRPAAPAPATRCTRRRLHSDWSDFRSARRAARFSRSWRASRHHSRSRSTCRWPPRSRSPATCRRCCRRRARVCRCRLRHRARPRWSTPPEPQTPPTNSSCRRRDIVEGEPIVERGAVAGVVRRVRVTGLVDEPPAILRSSVEVIAGIDIDGAPDGYSGRKTDVADVKIPVLRRGDPVSLRVPDRSVLHSLAVNPNHAQPRVEPTGIVQMEFADRRHLAFPRLEFTTVQLKSPSRLTPEFVPQAIQCIASGPGAFSVHYLRTQFGHT